MSRIRAGHALAVLLAFTASAMPEGPAAEAKRLAGTWRGVGGVWNGKALTAEQARRCVLTFHPPRSATDLSGGPRGMDLLVPDGLAGKGGARYGTEWRSYSYSLDTAAKPAALKAFKLNGMKGHGIGGVYRAEGDTLTICIGLNNLAAYPKEVKSPPGCEALLLTLKRDKK